MKDRLRWIAKWTAIVLGVVVAFAFVYWVPEWQYHRASNVSVNGNPLVTDNEYRLTIVQILGGIVVAIGAYYAWRRWIATDRQNSILAEQQVTERFTRAIDQLGSPSLEIRLGGIYALERIAKDSPRDHWTVMEVLTAFVRERAKWDEKNAYPYPQRVENMSYEEWRKVVNCWRDSLPRPATDIQAILTVLGRRDRREEGDRRLDLSGVDIRQADLREAHLEKATLRDAHLEGAEGIRVHLEGTTLICAHLERANLIDAHLKGTTLLRAHLEGADLSDAHLECANLVGAIGLTQGQINSAILDKYTKLPSGLHYPALDRKEPEPS